MTVPQKLKALRKLLNLTQEDLAARSGVHRVSIVRIEGGQIEPKIGTLVRLVEAMGCSLGDLFSDDAA